MKPELSERLVKLSSLAEFDPPFLLSQESRGDQFVLRFALGLDWTILKRSEGSRRRH